jgi:hypothetical protein
LGICDSDDRGSESAAVCGSVQVTKGCLRIMRWIRSGIAIGTTRIRDDLGPHTTTCAPIYFRTSLRHASLCVIYMRCVDVCSWTNWSRSTCVYANWNIEIGAVCLCVCGVCCVFYVYAICIISIMHYAYTIHYLVLHGQYAAVLYGNWNRKLHAL